VVHKERKVQLEVKDLKVYLELKVHREQKEAKELKVQKEKLEFRVHRELQVFQEYREQLVRKVDLGYRVFRVQQVHKVLLEKMELANYIIRKLFHLEQERTLFQLGACGIKQIMHIGIHTYLMAKVIIGYNIQRLSSLRIQSCLK
jgi:hypothetical protein